MTAITLTDGQQAATNAFMGFLADETQSVFVLEGYSGTGKSTLIKYLLDNLQKMLQTIRLINPGYKILAVQLTATTNKAAENFQDITGLETLTIHSFLGLRLQRNYHTGNMELALKNRDTKPGYLVFIDEASYVDSQLMQWIFQILQGSKIVFIGDPAQLTPVKSNRTPVFEAGFPTARLTEVVRQAKGNPIIELATKFRETVKTGQFFSFTPDGVYIRYMQRDAFNQAVLDEFSRKDWKSRDSRVLAWTNQRVMDYNKGIREHMGNTVTLKAGDYAVCNEYFCVPNSKQSIKTDESVLVTHSSEQTSDFGVTGRYLTVENRIKAFCPDNFQDKIARIRQAKAENDYETLEHIETRWIDLRPMYACTINKSQGSTYDRVFVDLDDIKRCNSGDQIARMLYVGVSRARHQVFLTGDLV